jgi:hypothetical protein
VMHICLHAAASIERCQNLRCGARFFF